MSASKSILRYFNSRPHEEVDLADRTFGIKVKNISTHDLTRRSTYVSSKSTEPGTFQLTTSRGGRHLTMDEGYEAGFTFQLTTSRGGRPNPLPMQALICYFNSRPHEEVDKTLQTEGALAYLFQLTTSRGGRHGILGQFDTLKEFQLTTSRGGRPGR